MDEGKESSTLGESDLLTMRRHVWSVVIGGGTDFVFGLWARVSCVCLSHLCSRGEVRLGARSPPVPLNPGR